MAGIENIREFVNTSISVGMAVAKARSEDSPGGKKITALEGFNLALKTGKVWGAVKIAPEAWREWRDLDEEEIETLTLEFNKEFDITKDDLEIIIEKAYEAFLRMNDFVDDLISRFGTE